MNNNKSVAEMFRYELLDDETVILLALTDVFGDITMARNVLDTFKDKVQKQVKSTTPRGYHRWSDEDKKILIELWSVGAKRSEIAARIGITEAQVSSMANNLRLRRKQNV